MLNAIDYSSHRNKQRNKTTAEIPRVPAHTEQEFHLKVSCSTNFPYRTKIQLSPVVHGRGQILRFPQNNPKPPPNGCTRRQNRTETLGKTKGLCPAPEQEVEVVEILKQETRNEPGTKFIFRGSKSFPSLHQEKSLLVPVLALECSPQK